ncbi:efflux RND transporter periplasmic adaptor subunit [Echinicola sp. CAU 1574]|uniref:Efflux RND transporter periplasmic adaptor subunit n=1 Tax=Echinicola arenosa TaxID=2774144 RepID=A0ABR9AN96_9BACT|nr:efflux RND transporter periplasmic adaptor subunit [Echinicola arenosa]MBD8489827.1 efflux RND transporter periplasmic adaptor subunit [Echinicola arenosa]
MNLKPLFFLPLLAVSVFFSCETKGDKAEEIPIESMRKEVAGTKVTVAKAEKRSFDYLINASGKVEAAQQVTVIIQRQGYLKELDVKEGQSVQAGTLIAQLDNTNNIFQKEKAWVQLKNAQASYNSEKLGYATIFEGENTDQITMLEEQLKASSGLLSAEIELKEVEMELAKAAIKAPISGKVADLKIKPGSLVNAGDELCEILSTNLLELHVKVLESDIPFIALGQIAEVYPVSGGTGSLSGKVSSINPKVDENGLVEVGIQLSGASKLLPGMNARAVIRAPQTNSVVVPKQALVYRSGRPVVFTLSGTESKWNYVEVGKDNGREIEILDGVKDGETVITSNNLQLGHQAQVQVVEENK